MNKKKKKNNAAFFINGRNSIFIYLKFAVLLSHIVYYITFFEKHILKEKAEKSFFIACFLPTVYLTLGGGHIVCILCMLSILKTSFLFTVLVCCGPLIRLLTHHQELLLL